MERNNTEIIKITDMTAEGAGFGRTDGGLAVFVEGSVPGDLVKAEIIKQKKNFADARISEIIEASSERVLPACPYFEKCGGCSLQSLSYDAQLKLKKKQIRDKLERIGEAKDFELEDCIGMDEPFAYRNKAEYPACFAGGKSIIGFYERKSHRIVNLSGCMLQTDAANTIADTVRKYNKGEITQVIVKTAFGTGDVMLILECDPEKTKYLERLIHEADEAVDALDCGCGLESVYSLNNGKYKLLAGSKTILDEVCFGLQAESSGDSANENNSENESGRVMCFEISAPSFYQVNTQQMIKLYAKAAEYSGLAGNCAGLNDDVASSKQKTVLDLYCGIGTIGLYMAAQAKQVIGIEIVKEAVIDANRNAVINGIVNARYICGKAEAILPSCVNSENEFDEMSGEAALVKALAEDDIVAILDPPRAGCDAALLTSLAQVNIPRIVYISCDPATLARDVKLLGELGYKLEKACPVDMFPQTGHVETVVLLRREKPDAYVVAF